MGRNVVVTTRVTRTHPPRGCAPTREGAAGTTAPS